jgi:hypothetical protein
MTVPLYAFRLPNNPVVYYVVDTHKRVRVTGETDRVQLGIASADVHVLDTSNWLWSLPIANP